MRVLKISMSVVSAQANPCSPSNAVFHSFYKVREWFAPYPGRFRSACSFGSHGMSLFLVLPTFLQVLRGVQKQGLS